MDKALLDGLDSVPTLHDEDDVLDIEAAERSLERYFEQVANSDDTASRLNSAIERGQNSLRFELNVDSLRDSEPDLVKKLLTRPMSYFKAAEDGLRRALTNRYGDERLTGFRFLLSITGELGSHLVTPRGLRASLLSKMVSVEGIVTKMGQVKPKLVSITQFCRTTNKYRPALNFTDGTEISGAAPTPLIIQPTDELGNPLEVEFGESTYRDHQKFTIQEMPESAPLGQLPRSIEVVCEDDLVDLVKPGDRVCCTGIYRAINVRSVAEITGMFRTALICNSVHKLGKEIGGIKLEMEDIQTIKEVAKEEGAFERLSKSLAPSIYGHEYIKKAILLLMLGGSEKTLENGGHLRGDINILIVGDPSTAKSQMLRFVLGIAPLAISTTGRGSTGVGLTAAVTSDPDTGERRLEAGAMVLADRGVVCIDEFDKMGEGDRVAIHEVMEQQTVTIAKAGIHASLNARCSVVAAANPIYGQYNKDLSPQKNIGLPDSLLSRFDLLFVVLDNSSSDTDRAVADHVLRIHRYQQPGWEDGKPIPLNEPAYNALLSSMKDDEDDGETQLDEYGNKKMKIFEKYNPVLHPESARTQQLFNIDFMRKFIFAAKNLNKSPKLTEETRQLISDEYAALRGEQATKTLPITPRCLETLIRLSTAHAKCRFSPTIDAQDVEIAREVLRFALYNDTDKAEERRKLKEAKETSRKRITAAPDGSSDDDDDDDDGEEELSDDDILDGDHDESKVVEASKSKRQRRASKKSKGRNEAEGDEERAEEEELAPLTEAEFELRRDLITKNVRFWNLDKIESINLVDVLKKMNDALNDAIASGEFPAKTRPFTQAELRMHFQRLDEENYVMFRDDVIMAV